jgi:hypothetical protein
MTSSPYSRRRALPTIASSCDGRAASTLSCMPYKSKEP